MEINEVNLTPEDFRVWFHEAARMYANWAQEFASLGHWALASVYADMAVDTWRKAHHTD